MHASNSNTCHENVRFVNCLICSTLQLALQNRQYLSTEEFFSPDLVDMNHTPKSPRAKQNKNSQYEEDGRIGANTIISLFFSSFQNVIRNIIYGAARTNITISSDDNTYKIVLIQSLMAEEKKVATWIWYPIDIHSRSAKTDPWKGQTELTVLVETLMSYLWVRLWKNQTPTKNWLL